MKMFVSWIKYKKLVDARNQLFMDSELESLHLKMELRQKEKQLEEYKKLYADELQKRLELAERVRNLECV